MLIRSLGTKAAGLRLERMQASPLWSGAGFKNKHPILPGLRNPNAQMPSIREFLFSDNNRTPKRQLPRIHPIAHWLAKPDTGFRVTWLGHSTVLLEMDGFKILTDPVWGLRASPFQFAGPKRFQPMPVSIAELPPLDAIVVSHDHYDHLDYTSIKALAKLNVPFVTSLGVGAHMEHWGVRPEQITELDWWESVTFNGGADPSRGELTITAAPAQHFSGRSIKDRNATLWSSMAIRTEHHNVFFGGDTGLTTEYADIAKRLGPFDLMMLEIGAFHPAWGDIHLGPENALKAFALLDNNHGGFLLPIHWATFALAMHAWDEPAEVLVNEATKQGVNLFMPKMGEAAEPLKILDQNLKLQPWWHE